MKLGNVEVKVTCPVKKFEFFDIAIEKLIYWGQIFDD